MPVTTSPWTIILTVAGSNLGRGVCFFASFIIFIFLKELVHDFHAFGLELCYFHHLLSVRYRIIE